MWRSSPRPASENADTKSYRAKSSDPIAPREVERGAVVSVLALGFVSGGVALAYEVLWTRELLNLLGSTTRAATATLAAFMAGLALGAWLAGRWSVRLARPLRLFAAAEAVAALFALVFPQLLDFVTGFLSGSFAGPGGNPLSSVLFSVGVHVALLLAPTVFMGAALPALAAALQGYGAVPSRYVAWLYGLNTLGGAVAAITVGFGVLPAYGLAASEKAAALAGLLAAGAAAVLSAARPPARAVPRGPRARSEASPQELPRPALGLALFLSGVAALGYEILWTRTLVLVVGSSTYAFTLMLGLYVFALALGGFWVGRYVGRFPRPAVALQHLQLGVAAGALAGVALFGKLPGLALAGFASLGTSPWSVAVVNAAVAGLVVLPPTVFIGASLPVAARLMERGDPRRGRELGTALAWVTAGNVAGVLIAAFGVIPAVGLQRGVALLAALNVAAAVVLWVAGRSSRVKRGLLVPAAALFAVIVVPLIPPWDVAVMTSGIFRQARVYLAVLGSSERLGRAFAAYRTLYYREGSEAVVAVFDRPTLQGPPHRVLTLDGKVDASTGADMATQVLSGHLPFLFRPNAESALVIGLASGVTVGTLAQHPFANIDVVEIEPAVVEASHQFDEVSGAPLGDPRVMVVVEDGRRYLDAVATRYDVIVSEPSNPWLSMSARLFTREFFTLVRQRLAPGGVLVQWIPLYGLSTPQFEALLRTLLSVFPNLALFHVAEGDLVAVAMLEPLSLRANGLENLLQGPPRDSLHRLGIDSPADVLALWIADARGLQAVLGKGPLNTDDNGLVEFGSPWYLLRDTRAANLAVVRRAAAASLLGERLIEGWFLRKGGVTALRAVARRHLARGCVECVRGLAKALQAHGRPVDADLLLGDAAYAEGKFTEAEGLWRRHEDPGFWVRRARLAFGRGDLVEAAQLLDQTPRAQMSPKDDLTYSLALAGTGRADEALTVLAAIPSDPLSAAGILSPLLQAVLFEEVGKARRAAVERRRFDGALNSLRRCLETDGCRDVADALVNWGRIAKAGVPPAVWEDLRRTLYVRVTRPLPHYFRGVTQLWLGDDEAGHAALRTYLKLLPEPDSRSKAHALLVSPLASP